MDRPIIRKIGAAIIKNNKILVVKESGWEKYGLPGGTIKPPENDIECLARELKEELGVGFESGSQELIGTFHDKAMNEPNTEIEIKLYLVNIKGKIKRTSEVEEMFWFGKNDDHGRLGPIDKNHLLPQLIKMGLVK
jgi:8-oxo-dGTP pyrophosphatase MutT (NUDIX family)